MRDFWVEWFGLGRGVGNPQRDYKATARDFVEWIESNEELRLCSYASVQPFRAYEDPYCIEKTFYDFDCKEDPDRAGSDAFDFAGRLKRFYDIEPLIVFSGNKGYHIYIFLEKQFGQEMAKPHLKPVYERIQRMLLGNSRYETLDSSVIGDIAQLARIPYTHHEKTGKICRPLDIKDLAYYREYGVPFELCKKALYKVGKTLNEKSKSKNIKKRYHKFEKTIRPCITDALSRSHPSHKMRQAIVAELHADGWNNSRIIETFSDFVDFDRKKTEYQVRHIVKKGYAPFRCSTIQKLGECLQEKCPIYRRRLQREE